MYTVRMNNSLHFMGFLLIFVLVSDLPTTLSMFVWFLLPCTRICAMFRSEACLVTLQTEREKMERSTCRRFLQLTYYIVDVRTCSLLLCLLQKKTPNTLSKTVS